MIVAKISDEQKNNIIVVCVLVVILIFAGFGIFHRSNKETPVDHTGEIRTSFSDSSFTDKQYYDAVDAFSREGFTNIKLISSEPSGLFPSENQIEKITIDGSKIEYKHWYKADALICVYYKRFSRQERNAYDEKTNQSLRFGDIALFVPSYFVIDDEYADYILFHDSQHKDSILKLFKQGQVDEWVDYQTHYPVDAGLMTSAPHSGQFTISIAKKNNVINRVTELAFEVGGIRYVLFMSCPDSERTTYEGDLVKISQSAFVPGEMDIMLDVKMSDLLGVDYKEVYQYLSLLGFTNIETQGMNDVVIGLFLQPGIVDKVLINGEMDYKPGDWVKKDAQIVIMHHSNK